MIKKEIINKGPLIVKGLGMRTNSMSTRMMDSSSSSAMNNGGSGVGEPPKPPKKPEPPVFIATCVGSSSIEVEEIIL